MEKKNTLSMLNYFDRGLLVAAVLALFISGKKIIHNFFLEQVTQENILNLNKANSLGAVSFYSNDARYKPSNSFNWTKANIAQKIYQSDSIFVGAKSKADVLLNDQSQIAIGENSLVIFNKIQQIDVANLKLGNFSLNVNGSVKLAIQDEVIEIKGKQTKIQIFIDKNKKAKPIIKTLTGHATVQYKKEKHQLKPNDVLAVTATSRATASVDKEVPTDMLPAIALANGTQPASVSTITAAPEQPRIPLPKNEWSENYIYHWKLYDLYKLNGQQLVLKNDRPPVVPIQYKLNWKNFPEMKQITYVMVSNNKDFSENFKLVTSEQSEFTLQDAYIGMNYWRISYDQQNWSITHQLQVMAQDREEVPQMTLLENNLPYMKKSTFANIHIDALENTKGYVVEISPANNFPQTRTEIVWNSSEHIKIPIQKPGILYVRARRVFMNTELSAYGNTVRIDSYRKIDPPRPAIIQLAQQNLTEKFPLTKNIQVPFAPIKPEIRELSSETAQVLSPVALPEEFLNESMDSSQLQLQMGSFSASSTDQKLQSKSSATGLNAGLNYLAWLNKHGLIASYKTKVSDGTSSIGSPTQMSLMYMRHLLSGSLISRMKVIGLAGFETYRNKNSSLYSPKHDLIKIGANILLPVSHRWGISSDATVGFGMDQSKHYELSARAQYYFSKRWFLGLGYKLYLFEAGSEATSPSDLPYREVIDESYSVFGYQF